MPTYVQFDPLDANRIIATVTCPENLAPKGEDWAEVDEKIEREEDEGLQDYQFVPAVGVVKQKRPPTSEHINAERDRRILMNFWFKGHRFDYDEVSRSRIVGMAARAGILISMGTERGSKSWTKSREDFSWIDANNQSVEMNAEDMFFFGEAAAEHETNHVYAARALKDQPIPPLDYKDDKYWPKTEATPEGPIVSTGTPKESSRK